MNCRIFTTVLRISPRQYSCRLQLKRPTQSWSTGPSSQYIHEPSHFPGTPRSLLKPGLFAVGFSGACFGAAAIATYENFRKRPRDLWGAIRESQRQTGTHPLTIGIIVANVAVFAAWRIRGFQRFMIRYFTSRAGVKTVCSPMFLSLWSHTSPTHLFFNMFAFWSFAQPMIPVLGVEQFLALYCSSGVMASFASIVYKTITKSPIGSVGASGALLGIVATHCSLFPDSRLEIIFLPFFTFTAAAALQGIIIFDVAGIVMKWKLFDHAAHLGGTMFGLFYIHYGHKYYREFGKEVIQYWRKLTSR